LLEVRDNGVGLPIGFNPAGQGGMGMKLLRGLADQIDGTYSVTGDTGGTVCSLRFSLREEG